MANDSTELGRNISVVSTTSHYDETDLQGYRDKLFNALNNNRVSEFESILQNNDLKRRLRSLNLDTNENSNGLTLMQEASKLTEPKFVEALLKSNVKVNANCKTDKEEKPVLVAARHGNWRVLAAFKKHNEELVGNSTPINFAVWTSCNQDTVLHLILTGISINNKNLGNINQGYQQESTRKKSDATLDKSMESCSTGIQSQFADYRKCISVLVDNTETNGQHFRELMSIVNKKNKQKKTPLHFAVTSWPKSVVKILLNLGADVGVTWKNFKPLLSKIPASTISEYLDEYCVCTSLSVPDDTTRYDHETVENDENYEMLEYQQEMEECNPVFAEMVKDSNVKFSYRFLLPPETITEMSCEKDQAAEKTFKKQETLLNFDPEMVDKQYEKKKRKLEFREEILPEMKILEELSESREHKCLLVHPVIKSFLHLKWKKISPIYERNLKFNILFVYCIIWYIFNQFGGLEFNASKNSCTPRNFGFDHVITDNSKMQAFCKESKTDLTTEEKRWKKVSAYDKRAKFYNKYQLTGFAEEESGNTAEEIQQRLFESFSLYNNETDISCNYANEWYIIYAIISLTLIILSVIELINSVRSQVDDDKSALNKLALVIPSQMVLIGCILPVLLGSKKMLWLTISIITMRSLAIELAQFVTSACQGSMRYMRSFDNFRDLAIIVLTFMLLFYPNEYINDEMTLTLSTHVKMLCDTSHLLTPSHNQTRSRQISGTGVGFGADVTVKRKISSFLIVLSSMQLMAAFSLHPMMESFNFYLMMFTKVSRRFINLLVFYGVFIISFGLGFYIIFHNDVGDSILEVNNVSTSISFESPYTALMKVCAMFLGEIDFSSMPIGIAHGRKDGRQSETLAYAFIALFMFMIVLVLNNLLNGLAVSDTEQIIKSAKVLHQKMYIDNLSHSDCILHSMKRFMMVVFEHFKILRPVLNLGGIKSYFLMESEDSDDGDKFYIEEREVEMNTPDRIRISNARWIVTKFNKIFLWDVSENALRYTIASEAKQIIIDRKTEETKQKKLRQLAKDENLIQEQKIVWMQKIENIENILSTMEQLKNQ